MKKNQKGFSVVEAMLILIIVGILGFTGWYVMNAQSNANKSFKSAESTKMTTPLAKKANITSGEGIITGKPSYPSSEIPVDEKVCAYNISDSTKEYCDNVGEKQTKASCSPVADSGCDMPPLVNFSIRVPVGDYYVYASTGKQPGYKSYFNEFAKCGNNANCPASGHTQYVKVVVKANETVDNVNPSDWYAN